METMPLFKQRIEVPLVVFLAARLMVTSSSSSVGAHAGMSEYSWNLFVEALSKSQWSNPLFLRG
jgi:hypothetical protein